MGELRLCRKSLITDLKRRERKREIMKMKNLYLSCICQCSYYAAIEVPEDMSIEEAIEYAKDHLDEIPLGELEYIANSDEVDVENCYF